MSYYSKSATRFLQLGLHLGQRLFVQIVEKFGTDELQHLPHPLGKLHRSFPRICRSAKAVYAAGKARPQHPDAGRNRYALENHLLDAVNHGDAELAMQVLQSFRGVTIPGRKGHTKTTTVRFRAVALNALLRKEAERAEVHAFYLDTLYNDYLLAAGEITTEQQEQALVVEMLQQYCDRVARYSTAGYSVVIRNIIHYINLHLKKDLTLSTLTARFNLSRSYLSDLLHREAHSNLTNYVTLTRIQFAANLLWYHHYTITQAAQDVGIPVVPYPPVQAHHRRDAVPLRPVESHRGLRDEPAKKKNFAAALIWPPCNPL